MARCGLVPLVHTQGHRTLGTCERTRALIEVTCGLSLEKNMYSIHSFLTCQLETRQLGHERVHQRARGSMSLQGYLAHKKQPPPRTLQ